MVPSPDSAHEHSIFLEPTLPKLQRRTRFCNQTKESKTVTTKVLSGAKPLGKIIMTHTTAQNS
uniref:Uncharacterized protein n=1 Tax=Anguilla anguilla TaxID=7936 RepID=A0A0E9S074_ANGAN